jgi:hypothetical protein
MLCYAIFNTECTNNTYGIGCNMTCDCDANHTLTIAQTCDTTNGTCLCLPTWTGTRCDIDVDECTLNTHNCTGMYEGCTNINGGFNCSCWRGYTRNNSTCVLGMTIFIYLFYEIISYSCKREN